MDWLAEWLPTLIAWTIGLLSFWALIGVLMSIEKAMCKVAEAVNLLRYDLKERRD